MSENNNFKELYELDKEYKEKISKLLNNKESDLDTILSAMTEKEKKEMINWGLRQILAMEKHNKETIFKWIHKEYNRINE